MTKRMIPSAIGAFALMASAYPALAQAAGWDGTWTGTTARGGAVQIVIASGQVQSYTFNGQTYPIGSSSVRSDQVSFTAGTAAAVNSMTPAGKGKASWTFNHPQIGQASATLTKR